MLQCQLIYITAVMLKQTRLSSVASTDCVFCNVIGSWKFLARKQTALMKPKESAECHQTISSSGVWAQDWTWSGLRSIDTYLKYSQTALYLVASLKISVAQAAVEHKQNMM